MAAATEVAGDVLQAATALGGLLLVFIGAVAAGFDSYDKASQASVRAKYQRRGWLAFVGFFLALVSAGLALAGKWATNSCLVIGAVVCLGFAFVAVTAAALISVMAIK